MNVSIVTHFVSSGTVTQCRVNLCVVAGIHVWVAKARLVLGEKIIILLTNNSNIASRKQVIQILQQ